MRKGRVVKSVLSLHSQVSRSPNHNINNGVSTESTGTFQELAGCDFNFNRWRKRSKRVAIVFGGKCCRWRLFWVANVVGGECSRWKMLSVADVLGDGCCRWQIFSVVGVVGGRCCRWRIIMYPDVDITQ